MPSIAKSPSYLIRNTSSYCFRMCVPKDLKPIVGKTELRYSLRTGSLSVAKHRARNMACYVQSLFLKLRAMRGLFMEGKKKVTGKTRW